MFCSRTFTAKRNGMDSPTQHGGKANDNSSQSSSPFGTGLVDLFRAFSFSEMQGSAGVNSTVTLNQPDLVYPEFLILFKVMSS